MAGNNETQADQYLSPLDVGEMLSISPIIVRKMVQDGKLTPVDTSDGLKRFTIDEVERFACDNDFTITLPKEDVSRILIVDDDEIISSFIIELLQPYKDKTQIQYASNAQDAREIIKSFKPQVILLDIMMPELNGFDICNLLKLSPLTRSIRIIAITGACTEDNIKTILASGAEACLPKPVDSKKLLDIIGLSKSDIES
ncbi:MAG: response regulator [Gammaproteobacteria bacterium]|nr:response regulator [Gammaproteobacteria bacterium]